MKILYFSHYFPPESNAPANRCVEHARRWVQLGHQVTVITCNPNHPQGVLYEGYTNERRVEAIHGIRVVRVRCYLAANSGAAKRIIAFLSYMVSAVLASRKEAKPDLVLATTPQFFCGWAGCIAAALKRVPFVLEVRDIWPQSIVTVGAMKQGPVIRMLEWLERKLYGAAHKIIAVGEGYKKELCSKGVPPKKIDVIPNGIDFSDFTITKRLDHSQEKIWGLDTNFVCSYIGTVGMAHGLEFLIDAAKLLQSKQVDDLRIIVVGDGARLEELRERVWRENVADILVFTGGVERALVPAILHKSDVSLVHLKKAPLFETVLPSKLFEPMALSKPILLGVNGEAEKVLRESGAGYSFEPEDAQAFVELLLTLKADASLRENLGKKGYSYVRANYDRQALAEQCLDTLLSVTPIKTQLKRAA